ncbi:MAG: hypothetical protein HOM96_02905 [Rickettsiales bacterium]|jgi:uncharacterized RDD family membrane protein YckC|nr:hypothetical protein [Rickettsiales bacterium]
MILFRPKIRPLFPNGTNLASFFTRSVAYFIDNFFVFTIRYLIWIAFNLLWFYDAMVNFYNQFRSTFSYTLSKPLQQFEYYEMIRFATNHSFFLDFIFVTIFIFSIGTIYYIFMHYNYQQTFGKMALGLKLLDNKTERPLSLWRVILRYILGLIPWIIAIIVLILVALNQGKVAMYSFVIGVIWYDPLLLGRDRRSVHDFLGCTRVIKVKKKAKAK